MSKLRLISVPGYGIGAPEVMIAADRITHFSAIEYNGRAGTEIYLETGGVIRTSASTYDVQKCIENAGTWIDGKRLG